MIYYDFYSSLITVSRHLKHANLQSILEKYSYEC